MATPPRPGASARQPATVAGLMRRHVVTLAPEDTLLEAFQRMRLARLRLVPVVRAGALVGVLAYRDLVRVLLHELLADRGDSLEKMPVERVMATSTRTVAPESRLADAATELCRSALGCVPVVEPGRHGLRLIGLVTEADLLRAAYAPLVPS